MLKYLEWFSLSANETEEANTMEKEETKIGDKTAEREGKEEKNMEKREKKTGLNLLKFINSQQREGLLNALLRQTDGQGKSKKQTNKQKKKNK